MKLWLFLILLYLFMLDKLTYETTRKKELRKLVDEPTDVVNLRQNTSQEEFN